MSVAEHPHPKRCLVTPQVVKSTPSECYRTPTPQKGVCEHPCGHVDTLKYTPDEDREVKTSCTMHAV